MLKYNICRRVKYYIYLFVAFIPWFFLSTCLGGGANCVVESANLVKKIYFPRIVIPLSTVTAGFVNLCLSMAVVLGAVLFSGIGLSAYCLLLPGVMALEYLLVLLSFMAMVAALALVWHAARDGRLLALATGAASHGMAQGAVALLKDVVAF